MSLRIAVAADLHWGHRVGAEAVRLMASFLRAELPDVLVLAGDLGVGPAFEDCLHLFDDLSCRKALTPGNHDIWVQADDAGHDSLTLYEKQLPQSAARCGFHYLDQEALLLPDDVALVGSINWYDYSWGLDELRRRFPGEEHRLRSKRFLRGRHNDANFVRWPLNDAQFTAKVVKTFEQQLQSALAVAAKAIVIAHHPPFHELSFPQPESPLSLDSLLWECFSGNRAMEEVLMRHAERIPFAFCGHTHRAREAKLGPIQGYNVGGDYSFKRLIMLNWPAGTATAHEFGNGANAAL